MMKTDEESIAVLFAFGARQSTSTPHSLFLRLPRVLRTRWTESYLATTVLPDLARNDLIEVAAISDGLISYQLTSKGERQLH